MKNNFEHKIHIRSTASRQSLRTAPVTSMNRTTTQLIRKIISLLKVWTLAIIPSHLAVVSRLSTLIILGRFQWWKMITLWNSTSFRSRSNLTRDTLRASSLLRKWVLIASIKTCLMKIREVAASLGLRQRRQTFASTIRWSISHHFFSPCLWIITILQLGLERPIFSSMIAHSTWAITITAMSNPYGLSRCFYSTSSSGSNHWLERKMKSVEYTTR